MPSRLKQSTALLCIGLVLSVGLAEPALAQTANIEGVLQNIVTMLTGNVARLLATLAVIIVGIAWMFGYLDLRKKAKPARARNSRPRIAPAAAFCASGIMSRECASCAPANTFR